MRTTAIFSYKGGVGKTTVAINLAATLAMRGKRVVLVDVDGQRNTTDFFGASIEGSTVYDLLTGREPCCENLLQSTATKGLCVVASSPELATVELEALKGDGDTLHLTALRDFVEALAEDSDADYVLIDCPPSFAPQSVAALLAADDVIVPITLDNWALSGLRDLTISMRGVSRANPALRIAGVVINRRTSAAVCRDAEEALRSKGYPVFRMTIRESALFARSSFDRVPLVERYTWTVPAGELYDLCDEYEGGGANGER